MTTPTPAPGIVAAIQTLGTFVFGSKESRAEQRVIIRRVKIYLLRKFGADGAADEIEENAKDERELAKLRTETEKTKAQVERTQQERKLQDALDILEKRRKAKEAKHAAVIDAQRDRLQQLPPGEREAATKKQESDRDKNAEDTAYHLRRREFAIDKAGGSVTIPPESIEAMDAFIEDRPTEPTGAAEAPPATATPSLLAATFAEPFPSVTIDPELEAVVLEVVVPKKPPEAPGPSTRTSRKKPKKR